MAKARAAALTNYIKVAESLGLDADAILARFGLDRAALADPDNLIDGAALAHVLDSSAAESGCPAFGLLMAESRPISGLGAVALLFRHQRTLRDAIRVLIRYLHILVDTLLISLDEDGETAVIRTDIIAVHTMTRQPIELTLGELSLALTAISGGEWHPECAHFVHDAPEDLSIHQRVLGCPVEFGAAFNGLTCASASLDVPLAGAEPEIARYAQASVERLARARDEGTISQRVRRALYLLLPAGRGTLEHVANDLGLHPRTLQRELTAHGTSFGKVLGDVRRELAPRHLATPSLSVEAIAVLVGFATLSSFSRWFTAEYGVSAKAWRAGKRPETAP